jgi:hypothetical protein
MLYGFVYGHFWIGEHIEVPSLKCTCDKTSLKLMVFQVRQYFWQAQHEWGESSIHSHTEGIEHDYAQDGFPKINMITFQSLQQYVVQISEI